MEFNPKPSTILHLDLNSCFATIEQQANPFLRGKPIAVCAYTTPNGCILAPSVEAKRYGVKTGMKVKDGKTLCPSLTVLKPDPWKYRNIHLRLRRLISDYTADFHPKSIDEFVLNLDSYLHLPLKVQPCKVVVQSLSVIHKVAQDIKTQIKKEIGDWITVSVGISTNRFLAKTAAGLHKPDGLDEINKDNFQEIYSKLTLTDLCGIKLQNAARLQSVGIRNVADFYNAPIWKLKAAFNSINGYYWWVRLHGYEIDDVVFGRRSYGNSYALPKPFSTPEDLSPILTKLVTKMSARLRNAGYKASGVHLAIYYRDGSFWHKGVGIPRTLFDSRDFYKEAFRILCQSPIKKPVLNLAVSSFNLVKFKSLQLDLFEDLERKEKLVTAVDAINERWGNFVIMPARMNDTKNYVPDRIAFGQPAEATLARNAVSTASGHQALLAGNVKEIEEFSMGSGI